MKLYRSAVHPGCWVAYIPDSGWVVFPAREHGWHDRRPARGLDPVHLRQAPLRMAAETGILEPENELASVA
ncbi:MAG TPA: hypothetical protein VME43_21555 [Bryobacteraceae bacterium]|nr:hypothetical protein [Bryobacteraceae bacterium]